MNAFQMARPRGADMPAKRPTKRKKKAVPITYSNKRVLNVNGKLQATLNPNASNGEGNGLAALSPVPLTDELGMNL